MKAFKTLMMVLLLSFGLTVAKAQSPQTHQHATHQEHPGKNKSKKRARKQHRKMMRKRKKMMRKHRKMERKRKKMMRKHRKQMMAKDK